MGANPASQGPLLTQQLKQWHKVAFIALVVAALLFVGSFLFPAQYQLCTPNEYTHVKECAQHYLGPYVILWVVNVIDAHNGFVTALGTLAIAIFTLTLYRATTAQGRLTQRSIDLTREQIELARTEYVSSHRPKLRIRHIVPRFRDGEPIKVHCVVTNIGETHARVSLSGATVGIFPHGKPGLQSRVMFLASDLYGGQSELFITQEDTDFVYDEAWNLDQPHGGATFIRGEIEYQDDNGTKRRTGFSRRYNYSTGRFDTVENPEDEYED